MPGYLLHEGATVQCAHPPGLATPQESNERVKVGGQNTILLLNPYGVTGCGLTNSPCTLGTWQSGASRVTSLGQPLVLTDSASTSIPNITPLTPMIFQQRVKAI